MLTGRRPFSGDTSADTMTAILKEEPPRVASLAPDVPPELVRVISRCLEKKAEHRIQSARDLGYALRDILADSGASRPSVTVAAPSRRSMVGVYVALGLTAVVALLFASNVGGLRERLFYSPDSRRIDSLAVLPLKNLSGDPEQEYFADGMTEALISELAKIGALKVISRTSAMQYKGATKPMPQIARELGVSALIEGSVVREGDQIRITVQMIHGPTDEHLWAETYQREMRGVLALQSEVARAIAREIRVVVTPEEETRLAAARPVNPEAHELYLRGRYHWTKRSEEGLSRAIQFFQQAIDIDPAYARAHAGLADVYVVQPMLGFAPPLEGFPRGRAAAIKALELDEHLAEAYATLGHIKSVYDRDWSGAEQDHKRALELNPNYATAHYWYGMLLSAWGRHEGAIAELEIAVKLDPLAPIISAMLGKVLYHARRYDEAAQQLRKTVDMHPDFYPAHLGLGWTYAQMGMHPEALAAVEKAKAEGLPEVYPEYGYVGWIYARAGRQDEAQRVLDRLRERSSVRYIDPGGIALIHIGLGQNEQAITWLERAYEHRGSLVILRLKVHPVFDPLREDPRFQDLLRRMNFTE
jgi:TolB-like protein/Tfp pilus assembly protein PilF